MIEMNIHWGGFIDPHSGIVSYKVAVGTQPYLSDIIKWTNAGKRTCM